MYPKTLYLNGDPNSLRILVESPERERCYRESGFHDHYRESEMSKLTTKARNSLPKKDFAVPSERKFPIENRSHAANAKARASQMEKAGKLSASEKSRIDAKADKMLRKGK